MSSKFANFCKIFLTVKLGLVFLLSLSSCDPCRQLAERICSCQSEDSKQQCMSDLSLASQHEYFSKAKEPAVCEEALKKGCSCLQFNNQQDAECGNYRRLLAK